jgi:hypothetical protein
VAFSLWDPKPLLERKFWPKPPVQVPNVVVLMHNPGPAAVNFSYRDDLWLWLPSPGGAPHLAGRYEIGASDAGLVHDALAPVKASGDTRLVLRLANQEAIYAYLKRGDTDLTFIFHRPDGSSFFSDEIPFTTESVKKYYARADMTPR